MTTNVANIPLNRNAARIWGIFFLLAFLSYGIDSGITANFSEGLQGLSDIQANKFLFTVGFLLMAAIHSFVNIRLAVMKLPILKPFNITVAYGYFGAAIATTIVVTVGAIFLILLIPLSDAFINANGDTAYYDTLAILLKKGGFYGYQLGMTLWSLGGLMLCRAFFRSGVLLDTPYSWPERSLKCSAMQSA